MENKLNKCLHKCDSVTINIKMDQMFFTCYAEGKEKTYV